MESERFEVFLVFMTGESFGFYLFLIVLGCMLEYIIIKKIIKRIEEIYS